MDRLITLFAEFINKLAQHRREKRIEAIYMIAVLGILKSEMDKLNKDIPEWFKEELKG